MDLPADVADAPAIEADAGMLDQPSEEAASSTQGADETDASDKELADADAQLSDEDAKATQDATAIDPAIVQGYKEPMLSALSAASVAEQDVLTTLDAPTAKLMDYSLADILSNFTTLAFGDLEFKTHNMGGPLCQGTFSGSGTCWDEGAIPAYVGGEFKYSSTLCGREHIPNQKVTLYVGSKNEVTNNGLDVNGSTVISADKGHVEVYDDYVDWAALKSAIEYEQTKLGEGATQTIEVTGDWQTVKIPAGANVNLKMNGYANLVIELEGSGEVVDRLHQGTIINVLDEGAVTLPLLRNCPAEEKNSGASLVFNYPNATSITAVDYAQQVGHIIAPNADIDQRVGNYNGCMVGKNITCVGEGHARTYMSDNSILTTPLKEVGGSSSPSIPSTPTTGKLAITKTIKGDVTAEEAEGALTFEVKNNADAVSAKTYTLKDFTKDKDGVYTLELEEAAGGYIITETTHDITGKTVTVTYKVGDGEVTEGNAATANVIAGQATTVAFVNDYENTPVSPSSHKVLLSKTDVAGDELAGAKLQLTGTELDGDDIEMIEWESGAEAHQVDLKPGTYTMTETACPEGYTVATAIEFTVNVDGTVSKVSEHATVSATDDGVPVIAMTDGYSTRAVAVSKEGAGGEGVVGATLTITTKDDNGQDKTVDTWETEANDDGTAKTHKVDGLTVGQEYTLTETGVPGNYEAAESITFKVDKDGNVFVKGEGDTFSKVEGGQLTMVDGYASHKVTLSKTDVAGDELAGAKLQLTGTELGGGEIAKVEWTSGDTAKEFELKPGTYTMTETAAPSDSYVLATAIEFTVNVDGSVTGVSSTAVVSGEGADTVIAMVDDYAWVEVTISNFDFDGHSLEGAHFKVVDEEGNDVIDPSTGEKIEWVHDGTPRTVRVPRGSFRVVQDNPPEGYEPTDTVSFTVNDDGTVSVDGKVVDGNDVPVENGKSKETPVPESKPETTNAPILSNAGSSTSTERVARTADQLDGSVCVLASAAAFAALLGGMGIVNRRRKKSE